MLRKTAEECMRENKNDTASSIKLQSQVNTVSIRGYTKGAQTGVKNDSATNRALALSYGTLVMMRSRNEKQ